MHRFHTMGRKFFLFTVVSFFILFCLPLMAPKAGQATPPKAPKTALVLAYFGSTMTEEANPVALIQESIARKHPEVPVLVAFTSAHVTRVLQQRGQDAKMLPEVLAALSTQGVTHVAVQSLHITPGLEFESMGTIAQRFANLPKGIQRISIGAPLLGAEEDVAPVAAALLASLPPQRTPQEAAVFVGHGAAGPGGLAYPALQAALWTESPLTFVGTLEGASTSSPKTIIAALKAKKVTTVWLAPLLGTVGDHARNDIFGSGAESWATQLTAAGFTVRPHTVGLFALPQVATRFTSHATAALQALENQ
ncbi:sirohydrochlorin cobaltochelatase [Desulfovibrio cuneatus]|uniref:sirohydrochlorin cobaltochelatase n=1 Tax=Desulfovibrio cuneatus TaxID=159728 RepID=UPI0003FD2B8F|nr:sirohydrochlorin cobaltochelatase [Desulfovibrio cuneatus]